MKTLKQEEIYCNQYADFDQLSEHLEEFLGAYYNRLRLHSALGYRTPEEFEREAAAAPALPGELHDAAVIKFFSPPILAVGHDGGKPIERKWREGESCP